MIDPASFVAGALSSCGLQIALALILGALLARGAR
jgi:hypothetical protein